MRKKLFTLMLMLISITSFSQVVFESNEQRILIGEDVTEITSDVTIIIQDGFAIIKDDLTIPMLLCGEWESDVGDGFVFSSVDVIDSGCEKAVLSIAYFEEEDVFKVGLFTSEYDIYYYGDFTDVDSLDKKKKRNKKSTGKYI